MFVPCSREIPTETLAIADLAEEADPGVTISSPYVFKLRYLSGLGTDIVSAVSPMDPTAEHITISKPPAVKAALMT